MDVEAEMPSTDTQEAKAEVEAASTGAQDVEEEPPTNAESLRLKEEGNAAYGAGEWAEAVRLYSDAIAADPTNHLLYSNRALASAQLEQWRDVLEDGVKCMSIEPSFKKGRWHVERACKQLNFAQPGNWGTLRAEGLGALDKGDDRLAVQKLFAAIACVPEAVPIEEVTDVHNRLGKVCMKHRAWNDAVLAFSRLGDLQSRKSGGNSYKEKAALATTRSNLGVALRNAGRKKEAKTALEMALQDAMLAHNGTHPMVATIWSNLGSWHECEGDAKEAIKCYSRWADVLREIYGECPQLAFAWLRVAKLRRAEDKAGARDLYERALGLWSGMTTEELARRLPEAPTVDRVAAMRAQAEKELEQLKD